MYVSVACACMSGARESQEKVLESLELELHTVD